MFIPEFQAGKKPEWLVNYLKDAMGFLEWWFEQQFQEKIYCKIFEVVNADWLAILTWEYLDHPNNEIRDEAGWCDIVNSVIYVRMSKPSFFSGLARFFWRYGLTNAQWWANYNLWKICHELSHLGYWLIHKPDKTHDFLFEFEYWRSDYSKTDFKSKDWKYVSQRVK